MRHRQDEPVRAYLLGALDDRHAGALEEKYFVDRKVLNRLRDVETALIVDFLEQRLSSSEKVSFEKRYLEIPDLKRRVEEVRKEFASARPIASRSMAWRLSLATVMLILVAATGLVYWRARQRSADSGERLTQIARNLSVVDVRLTPGVVKSGLAQSVVIGAPAPDAIVRLSLELPGRHSTTDYQARLAVIGSDGQRNRIWTSGVLRPVAAGGGETLTVDLVPNLLRPGDYIVEVGPPERPTLETYLLRVTPVR